MKRCIKCFSYAFNLYKEDIDQGDLCDVHYWKEKAMEAQPEQSGFFSREAMNAHSDCHVAQSEQRSVSEHLEPIGMVAKDGRTILFYELDSQKIEPFTEIYTTPPQRTAAEGEDTRRAWVGLTKGEAIQSFNEVCFGKTFDVYRIQEFYRAIESKLKEKNSA